MWTDFFVAASGASAALAGLLFVALSVNISSILRAPNLPPRAGAAIGTLILILVSSMAALVHQPTADLGGEILLFSVGCGWLQIVSAQRGFAARRQLNRPLWEGLFNAVLGVVQVAPFMAGGILLMAGREDGLYWVAAGSIAVFIFSVLNAWVLLVEILR
jgi:hypothetical protein